MERRYGTGPRDLAEAARWLTAGGLLVIPTETFYGLAVDPRDEAAVAALCALKQRPAGAGLPLIAGDPAHVTRCAPGWEDDPMAVALAARFWPGPLSIVLPAGPRLVPGVAAADGTVAVRITAHPVARDLCRTAGSALVATSANRRGAAPPATAAAARAGLGADPRLAVLDAGPVAGGRPSTIVRTAGGRVEVLREGAIGRNAIDAALGPAREAGA